MSERTKISALTRLRELNGGELVLVAYNGDNYAVPVSVIKEYATDGNAQDYALVFTKVEDGFKNLINGKPTEESGATIDIVYLSYHSAFVARKLIGSASSYYTDWLSKGNYYDGTSIRMDTVYICLADTYIYVYNGSKLFSPSKESFKSLEGKFTGLDKEVKIKSSIYAMTEEDFKDLQDPEEGAFYATYE